jgi:hypothetical protein
MVKRVDDDFTLAKSAIHTHELHRRGPPSLVTRDLEDRARYILRARDTALGKLNQGSADLFREMGITELPSLMARQAKQIATLETRLATLEGKSSLPVLCSSLARLDASTTNHAQTTRILDLEEVCDRHSAKIRHLRDKVDRLHDQPKRQRTGGTEASIVSSKEGDSTTVQTASFGATRLIHHKQARSSRHHEARVSPVVHNIGESPQATQGGSLTTLAAANAFLDRIRSTRFT